MSGPIDSYDAYAMGLRAARCNGCEYLTYKWKLNNKFLSLSEGGWTSVYELDAEPSSGQGEPQEHEGRPIRHRASFMSVGHSDECWGFRTPDYPYIRHALGETWKTADGVIIPIPDIKTSHLINILKMLKRKGVQDRASFVALRKEARGRTIRMTTGEESTVEAMIFPRGSILARIADFIREAVA